MARTSALILALMAHQAWCARIMSSTKREVASEATSDPRCLDPNGHAVDFFYAFKYPGGWNYAYMTKGSHMAKQSGLMNASNSAISRTLDQLYANSAKLAYAMWNDEIPHGQTVAAPRAHAKGVLAYGGSGGFWLTHSVPAFPLPPAHEKNSQSSYAAAKSPTYGQSFLCITIGSAALDAIDKLFPIDRMVVYASADPAHAGAGFDAWALNETKGHAEAMDIEGEEDGHAMDIDSHHPDHMNVEMADVEHQPMHLQGGHANVQPTDSLVLPIKSAGGQTFVGFAKGAKFAQDLYEGLVAPHFNKPFVTETWQNGVGNLPSFCKGSAYNYTVKNSDGVKFPNANWGEHQDHSKWAVSEDGSIFCVGDINRQVGQTKRGGGTVCIQDSSLAGTMRAVIAGEDDCGHDVKRTRTGKQYGKPSVEGSRPAKRQRKS